MKALNPIWLFAVEKLLLLTMHKIIQALFLLGVSFFLFVAPSAQAESCCVKAHVAGKECEHACCKEARLNKRLCAKCQPKASCCDRAVAVGTSCTHQCCVEKKKEKKNCETCNKTKE